ncbi:MAG TPA: alpha-2-macroglobulin family protein, partial [Abditibacterium sp.]
TILLDKKSYEEGETLRARLIADKPGATVLFTQETMGDILRRDVIKIDAQSKEISIPIEKKHVPNFFLAAALVQDFEVYQAQTEVFVPPTRQLLNLKVTGDKATYKPGETGTFQISARDYSGAPARAEVSLALIDASLFYIQKDTTPDMRGFYYGERRSNTVNLDSSRSGNPEARSENDEKTPNYEQHGFELPDEFGQLQLMPGGFGYYQRQRFYRGGGRGGGPPETLGFYPESDVYSAPMPAMAAARAPGGPTAALKSRMAANESRQEQEPVQVRSNFAETAYWSPAVITEGGNATVKVTFPDSLTQWHATARGLTPTVQVGSAETDVATKKDLLVRLQAPRFFVEKDKVVISANVHNYSDKTQKVSVALNTDAKLKLTQQMNGVVYESQETGQLDLEIAAGEEKRLDLRYDVKTEGQTAIQVTARTATDSDAVKMSFPVLVHGVQRFAGQSGTMPNNGTKTLTLNFPKERKFGSSQLNLQLNPSLGATMLDALPYLADYPYGCVEQTMSRFLPSVITARTLRDAGINLETLRARAKVYEAEAKAQPIGERVKNSGYSYPKGQPNSRDLTEMASQRWRGLRSTNNPVFDKVELDKMTSDGLNQLYGMQRSDGGWGWWPGSPQSDEYMSAYVVYGLTQAQLAGVGVKADALNRGRKYLIAQMKDEDNIHLLT